MKMKCKIKMKKTVDNETKICYITYNVKHLKHGVTKMKLTKKIKERVILMQSFLSEGNCIDISDNDACYIAMIDKIWINATGIWCKGFSFSKGSTITEYIYFEEFNRLFNHAKRNDADFREFIRKNQKEIA
jgi:hypothetical protein